MDSASFNLRPGVSNIREWQSTERKRAVPDRVRKLILKRDDYTCVSCGHRAMKWMHIHHLEEGNNDEPENLSTLCVACHTVMHMGRSLQYGVIEIWVSPISQVEIIHTTRDGIENGLTLQEIKKSLQLKKGRLPPDSVDWANELLMQMGSESRAELPEPLCAVFVSFTHWQIEL